MFVQTVRGREREASLQEVIDLLHGETIVQRAAVNEEQEVAFIHNNLNGGRKSKCTVCGKGGHTKADCWVEHPERMPICGKCNKKGHSERERWRKKKDRVERANLTTEEVEADDTELW